MRAVPKVRPYKNSLTLALSQREREFAGGFLFCRLIEWIERLYCRILNHLIQLLNIPQKNYISLRNLFLLLLASSHL